MPLLPVFCVHDHRAGPRAAVPLRPLYRRECSPPFACPVARWPAAHGGSHFLFYTTLGQRPNQERENPRANVTHLPPHRSPASPPPRSQGSSSSPPEPQQPGRGRQYRRRPPRPGAAARAPRAAAAARCRYPAPLDQPIVQARTRGASLGLAPARGAVEKAQPFWSCARSPRQHRTFIPYRQIPTALCQICLQVLSFLIRPLPKRAVE